METEFQVLCGNIVIVDAPGGSFHAMLLTPEELPWAEALMCGGFCRVFYLPTGQPCVILETYPVASISR